MSGPQYRLTGRLSVALPPAEAVDLFTPRGEERWVEGWRPRFPHQADDDTEPGTVFQTDAHGEDTTWVVIRRESGHRSGGRHLMGYARVTPGSRAGTVTVAVEAAEGGGSAVQVTYEMTALSEEGRRTLEEFAAGYDDFLRSWEEAIRAA